jgi:hypothetical protein
MATTIATLANKVQLHRDMHLSREFRFRKAADHVHFFSRVLFSPWTRTVFSGLCLKMEDLVAVWTENLEIIFRAISRVAVFVVDLKNARFFIPSALSAFWTALLENLFSHSPSNDIPFGRLGFPTIFFEARPAAIFAREELVCSNQLFLATIQADHGRCFWRDAGLPFSAVSAALSATKLWDHVKSVDFDKKRFAAVGANTFEVRWHGGIVL